jgi:shikimate kinase
MGSGKTAVGRRLATLLGMEFIDSDAEIEKRTGVDIRYIFEKKARARFASASATSSPTSRRSRAS